MEIRSRYAVAIRVGQRRRHPRHWRALTQPGGFHRINEGKLLKKKAVGVEKTRFQEIGRNHIAQMKGDPLLKSLEHDPRYAAFLKKMRLPA